MIGRLPYKQTEPGRYRNHLEIVEVAETTSPTHMRMRTIDDNDNEEEDNILTRIRVLLMMKNMVMKITVSSTHHAGANCDRQRGWKNRISATI